MRGKMLDTTAMAAAMGSGRPASYAPADGPRAEIGELCVPLSVSSAFAVATLEGALHENHDRGAAAILPDGTALFACLDGHGQEGASVSGYATRNLLAGCAAALQQGHSASDAITMAYHRTTSTMPQNVSDCRFSGSTAILMVIQHNGAGKRTATTGWVGDSRAVVARLRVQPGPARSAPKLETVPLTKDHKPTDPKERERLLAARACVRPSRVMHPHTGAWIEVGAVRVWDASQVYGVAMSRSLGDMQVHPYLISIPEIATRQLDDKDRIIVLATDGVWDVMENEEVGQLATGETPARACQEIVSVCARRWDTQMPGRRDDITSVVVDLTHPDLNPEGVSSS
jgi:serine/threonine protein phosphatase PrpC